MGWSYLVPKNQKRMEVTNRHTALKMGLDQSSSNTGMQAQVLIRNCDCLFVILKSKITSWESSGGNNAQTCSLGDVQWLKICQVLALLP